MGLFLFIHIKRVEIFDNLKIGLETVLGYAGAESIRVWRYWREGAFVNPDKTGVGFEVFGRPKWKYYTRFFFRYFCGKSYESFSFLVMSVLSCV